MLAAGAVGAGAASAAAVSTAAAVSSFELRRTPRPRAGICTPLFSLMKVLFFFISFSLLFALKRSIQVAQLCNVGIRAVAVDLDVFQLRLNLPILGVG